MVSCGGGGDVIVAGIGGTGITSGEITQFGSVYVNGVKFNTNGSQFEVDGDIFYDQPAAVAAGLSEGMVAKVYGTTNGDGVTGTADLVVYDNEVEGPITSIPVEVLDSGGTQRSFSIFNQTVIIDETKTFIDGKTFSGLAKDDLVEISGLPISDTEILATYVKWDGVLDPGTSEVELSGIIELHDDVAKTFTLVGVTNPINYFTTPLEDIQLTDGVQDGLFVEVDGIYDVDDTIIAIEIQEEDDDFGSDIDHISLQGIIADFTNTTDLLFTINGQFVDASGAVFYDTNEVVFIPTIQLANGVRIEVEGNIIGGMLFADEVELH